MAVNSFLVDKLKSMKIKSSQSKRKDKSLTSGGGEAVVEVHPLTNMPTEAWEHIMKSGHHNVIELPPDTVLHNPVRDDHLRFVCLSDTHGAVEHPRREFRNRIPDGDVLIHCGDFTMAGKPSEVIKFDSFMSSLPHPVKLVIAGNHELTFEENNYAGHPTLIRKELGLPSDAPESDVVTGCKACLQHLLYLQDETVDICGIKIYGSPWVPEFGCSGFGVRRGHSLLEKWDLIPSDTDILVTHGPPCGYGDTVGGYFSSKKAGCVELLSTVVMRVKPKYHVFGHIHNGHGMWTNKTTTFINAAVCCNRYRPKFDPIVFDFPLPVGYSRKDFEQLSTESLRQARDSQKEQVVKGDCPEDTTQWCPIDSDTGI